MSQIPGAIDYASLLTAALQGVLKTVLRRVEDSGLPGEHHLLISFRTDAPAVEVPARLRSQYPQEMTIVLQHQFWGLRVGEESFSVQLRFGGILERLTIPWHALTAFADPSVPFGLRFTPEAADPVGAAPIAAPEAGPEATVKTEAPEGEARVVAFAPAKKRASKSRKGGA